MTESDGEAVLVLTNRLDSTADLVVEHLNDRGVPVFRCDTAEFPTELTLAATLEDQWAGVLDNGYRTLDLSRVRSVYFRRPEEFRLPDGMSEAGRRFAAAQSRAGFVGVAVALPCLWINHPARDLDANHKPWQLAAARRLGLNPPRSIITNDPAAGRNFAAALGGAPVITKSLGAPVDTVVIDPADLDDSVRLCAHLFQEWIDKAHEVRLTVVGDRFFPVEIHAGSEAARIDWRTDYRSLTYRPTAVPDQVRERVSAFMREFGLVFGAFDFIVTPTGEWRFLEVNPNGQWSWIEHRTGVPIARAIADLLEKGHTHA
ncbi:ATP-grasp ribosomal peptide maturase [Streptomyces sp. 1331.2]|uniref:ATP-grasp ribosomal peptide maturase n=1 Tax=Streptomyces sp. 1331.2 TaxID=1938835 RepID=UPI000BDBB007|nr:ATP-grasp ribosomal peptide maturase [Streptomyces sp. 1331.2]SOB84726.1 ATP-grasp ribosomal peptide maturase, SAV_5884 family [Streptomyces sp. 1331.2]